MRTADPDQTLQQVAGVRQSRGRLRVSAAAAALLAVLGGGLVGVLDDDDQTRPVEDILAAGLELDEGFFQEAEQREDEPSEEWLPQVRARFLMDPTATITTGKSPDDNLLLITPDALGAFACYDLSKVPDGSWATSPALGELTEKPAC